MGVKRVRAGKKRVWSDLQHDFMPLASKLTLYLYGMVMYGLIEIFLTFQNKHKHVGLTCFINMTKLSAHQGKNGCVPGYGY